MRTLCKAERTYCIAQLKAADEFIPYNYVAHILKKAKKRGLKINAHKIRNVRNLKQFDKKVVDLFVELAGEIKQELAYHV